MGGGGQLPHVYNILNIDATAIKLDIRVVLIIFSSCAKFGTISTFGSDFRGIRNFWENVGNFQIFPNFFTAILGPTSQPLKKVKKWSKQAKNWNWARLKAKKCIKKMSTYYRSFLTKSSRADRWGGGQLPQHDVPFGAAGAKILNFFFSPKCCKQNFSNTAKRIFVYPHWKCAFFAF